MKKRERDINKEKEEKKSKKREGRQLKSYIRERSFEKGERFLKRCVVNMIFKDASEERNEREKRM